MLLCVMVLAFTFLLASMAFAGGFEITEFPLVRKGPPLHLHRIAAEGGGDAGQLLMVHGLTYSSHEFDVDAGDYSLARFFASKGWSVWLLDIAGYGSSGEVENGFLPNSDYAAEDIAAAAALILKESGQKKLDVLGWSWGTVTGGRFAARYPEMVRKIVLYAPIVAGLGEYEVTAPFNKNTWEDAAGDFQTAEGGAIDYEITEPAVVATFLSNCWRYDGKGSPNGGRKDLLVSGDKRLIPTSAIKSPALVITGDRDPYVTVELCKEAAAELKGSTLKVIRGASHAMMMEKPYYKEFREAVLDFLK
ncbi:MAG: alpha/beta fold hydrolase [Aminivibrio sp.]|jgi:pimeloyl-ACP methyl ester carboxylesterase